MDVTDNVFRVQFRAQGYAPIWVSLVPDCSIRECLNWRISEAVANRMRSRIGQNLVVPLDHVLAEEHCRLAGLTSMSFEMLARGGGCRNRLK